jgi:general secretion pathway protein I
MIEAVVTLALMSIVLAAIGSLVATITNGARALEQKVALIETARLIATSLPRRTETVEDLGGEVSGHRWQLRMLPFFDGGPGPQASQWVPQRVVLNVQSPTGAILSLETVRLQRSARQ